MCSSLRPRLLCSSATTTTTTPPPTPTTTTTSTTTTTTTTTSPTPRKSRTPRTSRTTSSTTTTMSTSMCYCLCTYLSTILLSSQEKVNIRATYSNFSNCLCLHLVMLFSLLAPTKRFHRTSLIQRKPLMGK